jgi:site-specific recombinase XerD
MESKIYIMTRKKQTLLELTGEFTLYLRKHRGQATFDEYRRVWNHVSAFMAMKRIKYYDPGVGEEFLRWKYGPGYSYESLPNYYEKNFASRVEALGDYQKLGKIVMGSRQRVYRVFKGAIGRSMTVFMKQRKEAFEISKTTMVNYEIYLYQFYLFLKKTGIHSVSKINKERILSFISQIETKRSAARHAALRISKIYVKYLYDEGLLSVDYSKKIPNDNYKKQEHLPSTYSEREIEAFLGAVDRGSPKGKRDYAIFLLIIKLGIRSSDIRNLKFENISWENSIINFDQQKTGKPLTLPLPAEVGNAVIDYLKFGRAVSEEPYCFLCIKPPYKKMGYNDIKNLVEFYLKRAKVCINNRSHGPHSLRHSFATHLLNSKTPLPVISEALGHSASASTMLYLRVDVQSLRQCALEVPSIPLEINNAEGGHRAR